MVTLQFVDMRKVVIDATASPDAPIPRVGEQVAFKRDARRYEVVGVEYRYEYGADIIVTVTIDG